jgi:hypothetical protein
VKKRSGWVVLLVVALATLGGAFAVRLKKRKRTAQPAPPAPRKPDTAARGLVRMAIGGAIAVVLAIGISVVTRPSDPVEVRPDPAMITVYSSAFRPSPGIGVEESVMLNGVGDDRAEVGIGGIDRSPERTTFTIRAVNAGGRAIYPSLASRAFVQQIGGSRIELDSGPFEQPQTIQPGQAASWPLTFVVPESIPLTELYVEVTIDGITSDAEWNLL